MSKKEKGSITVFCSLVFLLILALIGTMFDLAMWDMSKAKVRRSLDLGMYGLFTEYSRPLYKYYRLLFIEDTGKPFEQAIAEYMPSMTKAGCQGVKVSNKTFMTDGGGEPLGQEINQVMKYRLASNAMSDFLAKTKEVSGTEKEASQLEEKAQEQEEMAELDIDMLMLMELIDGAVIDGDDVDCADCFVKMYTCGKISPNQLFINHDLVWNEVSDSISNPLSDYESSSFDQQMEQLLSTIREAKEKASQINKTFSEQTFDDEDLKDYAQRMKDFLSSGENGLVSKLSQNESVVEQVIELLNEENIDLEEMKSLWEDYRLDIEFSYEGLGEDEGDDPLATIKDEYEDGMLGMILPQKVKVSNKSIKEEDVHYRLYHSNKDNSDIDYSQSAEKFLEDEEVSLGGTVNDLGNYTLSKFYTDQYAKDFFGDFLSKNEQLPKTALTYEREYILCGEDSDKSNLTSVANRIILLRSVVNAAAIFSNAKMRKQAYAAALAMVGFTGMEPLIRLTQTLIIIGWAMEESIVEMAILLAGKSIYTIKTSKQIMVKFKDLLSFSKKYVRQKVKKYGLKKGGVDYSLLLSLFMAGMSNDKKYYRMMDLMQLNLKKVTKRKFVPAKAVHEITASTSYEFKSKFFKMPTIQSMLNRKMDAFISSGEMSKSY